MQTSAPRDTGSSTTKQSMVPTNNWWLRMTSAWDKPQETVEQREVVRRSRLLSWILLGLFAALLLFVPATFSSPPSVVSEVIALIGLCVVALFNRRGWVTLAGILLVLLTTGATLGVIVGSPDGKIHLVDLPAYDFLSITVVLGASILPRISAFVVAGLDIVLIYIDMVVQNKAQDLLAAIHQYSLPVILGRPAAILVIIAVIAYLWVRGMDQAVQRADRAEEMRSLEQYFNQIEAERTAQVEEFVQEIIRAISALANGQEGLLLLPTGHPWQQQAVFINTQLRQFYKLKQANRGDNDQLVFAMETLLRVLQRFRDRQSLLSALEPRQFTTQVPLVDEIARHIYLLLQERSGPAQNSFLGRTRPSLRRFDVSDKE